MNTRRHPVFNLFKYRALPVLLAVVSVVFAQQEDEVQKKIDYYRSKGIQPLLGGIEEGKLAAGTYLIPHDIMIEKGKTLTLSAGVKILFTQNALLVVNGTLICEGTSATPVTFDKLKNEWYYRPIDPRLETRWDGIYLPDSALCRMRNTVVTNSKYGIVVSGKDVSMALDSVRFINNKFQNVKIGNRVMKINEHVPMVFNYPEQQGVFVEPAAVVNATETIQASRGHGHTTAHPGLRIGMGIAGGIGLICGATGYMMVQKTMKGVDEETLTEEIIAKANTGRAVGIAGAILFGIGATGFVWTFFY